MKKKVIEKRLLNMVAIGIGAGIMLAPVTAEAADGDNNAADPDEDTVNKDSSSEASGETAQAQEYNQASEASQQDVQTAHEALVDAAVEINEAAAFADSQSADAYQSAGEAVTGANDAVYEASQNLAAAEDFNETVEDLLQDAQEDSTLLQNKADSAAESFDAATNTANEAKEKAEGINVETTSLEDAEKAVGDAEALIDQAEQEKADADELLSQAESVSDKPDEDLEAIESAIAENEAQLAAAEENLQNAEDALADAQAAVDSTKPTEQEKYDLEHNMWQNIINRKAELAAMSETDEGYQTKLKELADIILNEYVLSDNDPFFSRDDYRDGKLNFEYTFSNGEMTIILPAMESGYYTTHGVKLDESTGTVYKIPDEFNGVDAIDTSDKSTLIASESADYETSTRTVESTSWTEYEMIENTETVESIHVLNNYEGYTGTVSDYPVAFKLGKTAEFNKINVSQHTETWRYEKQTDYAIAVANDTFNNKIKELKDQYGDAIVLDTSSGNTSPGCTINVGNGHINVTMFFKLMEKTGETEWLSATETYKSSYYTYKEGYEEQTVANTAKGQIKKDTDAQIANVQKLQEREDTIEAYSAAVTDVTTAKNTVSALQEKGRALVASLREKTAREATNNALAKSRLEIAAAAKEKAQTAIDSAKAAIQDASSKVSQIKEKLEKEKAEKEQAKKEQAEKEQAEKERIAKEQAEKERLAKEQAEKEQAEKERLAKEQAEKEQAERERLAKEQAEKEQAEKLQAEKEKTDEQTAEPVIEDGADSGSESDNSSRPSSKGEDTSADSAIDASSTNILPVAAPETISPDIPVLALGTDTRATALGANKTQFYKNLSEDLTRQILANKNAAAKAARNAEARTPGDMTKSSVDGQSNLGSQDMNASTDITEAETPLTESAKTKTPTLPLTIAFLFAAAIGISAEEYYRRKSEK